MKKIKAIVIMLSISVMLLMGLVIGSYSLIKSEMDAIVSSNDIDVVVVLGAGLFGKDVSPHLSRRLDTASEVLKQNENIITIVSGGQGDNELISEAEAMKKYLLDKKLRNNKIIKEDKSTSTFENLKYSKDIIDKLNIKNPKVAIVTADYHMFRAKMIAERLGFDNVVGYSSKLQLLDVKYIIREILAVIKDWLFTLTLLF